MFTRSDNLENLGRFLNPGRKIYVAPASGSDSAGDGSRSFPYATINRGFQDVRSGRNDILFVDGEGVYTADAPYRENNQVLVTSKDDWALVGLGGFFWGPPDPAGAFGPTSGVAGITGVSIDSATEVAFTTSHTYTIHLGSGAAPRYFLVEMFPEDGTTRHSGYWTSRTTFLGPDSTYFLTRLDTHTAVGAGGDQPYSGGPSGIANLSHPALAIRTSNNILIAGMGFSGDTTGWGGLVIDGERTGLLAGEGRNILVSNCVFGNATLGLIRMGSPTAIDFNFAGVRVAVENCVFVPFYGSGTFPGYQPSVLWDGMQDFRLIGCLFNHLPSLTGNRANGVIRTQGNVQARYGSLITRNIFNFGGAINIYNLSRQGIDSEPANAKIISNFYPLRSSDVAAQAVTVSPGGKVDNQPQPFVFADEVPGERTSVWGRLTAQDVAVGSFGELLRTLIPGAGFATGTDSLEAIRDAVDTKPSAVQVRDAILSDSTPFDGANIDAAISSREASGAAAAAVATLNDLSAADVTGAVYGATEATAGAAGEMGTLFLAIADYTIGDVQIDFTGNDALGWQLVVMNRADAEIARFNLFDEADARVTGTVAAFIQASKAIGRIERL